jgi:hypothetical protein
VSAAPDTDAEKRCVAPDANSTEAGDTATAGAPCPPSCRSARGGLPPHATAASAANPIDANLFSTLAAIGELVLGVFMAPLAQNEGWKSKPNREGMLQVATGRLQLRSPLRSKETYSLKDGAWGAN